MARSDFRSGRSASSQSGQPNLARTSPATIPNEPRKARRRIKEAEQQVARGENRIARQQQIIAELASGGQDLKVAQDLLAQYESTLALHVAHLERCRAQLAATG